MTAPDPEPQPPDETVIPTEALASGQRTLAAIVFTDTVGFSKLMSQNEELTLKLVSRDLYYMKTTCEAFGGQVLKSTGDGLLMLFTSAVQAVACALEIQRDFQRQNIDLPKAERLKHRIGIHLGDVFQHGGDVMGDGVNIAARLQTAAVPGGICLSQTVYDVVQNRLSFYVNDLGARTLKNIGKVTAYQISPADGERSRFRISWYRWKSFLSRVAKWLILPLAIGVFYLGMHREWASTHRGQPGAYTLFPLPKASPVPIQTSAEKAPGPIYTAAPPAPASPAGPLIVVSDQEFEMARFEHMQKYDFEGMRDWIATHDWPGKSLSVLDERCRKFQHLFRWLQEGLHNYSATNSLVVTASGGRKTSFWTVSFGGLKMKTDTQTVTVLREQIPPSVIVEIVDELLKEHPVTGEEAARIQDEANGFSEFYHVKATEEKEALEK
jgi:class 3 adenylate cyclase